MIVEKGIKPELRWFYEARFGMFVHFGLYALLGRGEWAQYHEHIPRDEYARLARQFNPSRFNADEWVQLALDAGARYITLTAKHHDGFCLFDSALTDYKITNTPFRRDLVGELIAACQRRDLRIILYYSQPDWHHPNYVHHRGAFKDLADPPATDRPDWPSYIRYYMGQVEELCTKYGRIDGIWFDGSHKSVEDWQGREVYALIKKYQPHAVVNDRARCGDFFTPERSLPENLTGYLFEACESISPTAWGYRADTATFAVPHLIRSLDKMNLAGGNYLLNVGPAPDGTIPARQADVMRAIGQWLRVNGEAVYRTDPVFLDWLQAPNQAAATGQCGATRSGNRLYIHCLDWPDRDRLQLPGIGSAIQRVRLLGSEAEITCRPVADGVELRDLPSAPPDPLVQIFELTLAEPAVIREQMPAEAEPQSITVQVHSCTELSADAAAFVGYGVKGTRLALGTDDLSGRTVIKGWWTPEQEAHWRIRVNEAGCYQVRITAGKVAAPADPADPDDRPVLQITTAGGQLPVDLPRDGLVTVDAGTLDLPAGESEVIVRPARLQWGYIFGQVASVELSR